MKYINGWWVPDSMSGPKAFVKRATSASDILSEKSEGVAVQAGGHIGTYPIMLTRWFNRVYTFEPDLRNFECLVRNYSEARQDYDLGSLFAIRGALGNVRGCVGINQHKNSGGHSVQGEGPCPIFRIDDLGLDNCELIYLDVEGYEIHALRGALKTITAYKPVIVAEENKQLVHHGFKPGDIEKLLAPLGYKTVRRVNEDLILECV